MSDPHLEFLVEEPSMEAFLRALMPRCLPATCTFEVHPFQGKTDLMGKLHARLMAYAQWLPVGWRIVVVVDRDDDDCHGLKQKLQAAAENAGLRTRSDADALSWQVVNRMAIEELEAWYFGDWQAVLDVYPRASRTIPQRSAYRDPDAIQGGTWEAFERIMRQSGYFKTGLRKIEAVRAIGSRLDPARNRSRSFAKLHEAIMEAGVDGTS